MLSIRALVTVVLLSALPTGQAAAQGRLWIVDSRGGADFTVLQSAIIAAADGDVLAVRGGPYSPIAVVGRQLTLVADQGSVRVDGPCRLTNIPEGGTLTLVGPLVFSEQLRVLKCSGTVWLEGGRATGLDVQDCRDLALVDYRSVGGEFTVGLRTRDSEVHAYRCDLLGAEGRAGVALPPFQPGCDPFFDLCFCECCTLERPFRGSEAVVQFASLVVTAACVTRGGDGGQATRIEGCFFQEGGMCGADGGTGLRFSDAASRHIQIGGTLGGGFGTPDTFPPPTSPLSPQPCDGIDGEPVEGGGILSVLDATVGRFDTPEVVASGQPFELRFQRPGGGLALWSWTTAPDPVFVSGLRGTVFADQACNFAGVLSGSQPLAVPSPAVQLPPRIEAMTVVLQAYFVDPAPLRVTAGPPQATVILQ